MDLVSLVSNNDQRIDKNVLKNMISQSNMMVIGSLNCTHTHSNKSLVMSLAVILFLQAIIMPILENRSTTTNT
jgi:hypothetical protein